MVKGKSGECAGTGMEGGSITIYGDADDFAGLLMVGGVLNIEGDAGEYLGDRMTGTTVVAHGVCQVMRNSVLPCGEIHVNGEIVSISDRITRGKIYHKGELIFER